MKNLIKLLLLVIFFIGCSKREDSKLLFNLNGTTESPREISGIIKEDFISFVQNTSLKDEKVFFRILNKDIKIYEPKEPFFLKANKSKKVKLVLGLEKKAIPLNEKEFLKFNIELYIINDENRKELKTNYFRLP